MPKGKKRDAPEAGKTPAVEGEAGKTPAVEGGSAAKVAKTAEALAEGGDAKEAAAPANGGDAQVGAPVLGADAGIVEAAAAAAEEPGANA
eukprot:995633-Amphidinium_carterae.1